MNRWHSLGSASQRKVGDILEKNTKMFLRPSIKQAICSSGRGINLLSFLIGLIGQISVIKAEGDLRAGSLELEVSGDLKQVLSEDI